MQKGMVVSLIGLVWLVALAVFDSSAAAHYAAIRLCVFGG
jgi:hypothetical protein